MTIIFLIHVCLAGGQVLFMMLMSSVSLYESEYDHSENQLLANLTLSGPWLIQQTCVIAYAIYLIIQKEDKACTYGKSSYS